MIFPCLNINKEHCMKILWYVFLILILFFLQFILGSYKQQFDSAAVPLIGFMATLVALFIGALSLVRYYTEKSNKFLLFGVGFLATALLDGYHGLMSSFAFDYLFPSSPSTMIYWSWLVSRTFLAIMVVLSWYFSYRQKMQGKDGEVSDIDVYTWSVIFTFLPFFLLAFFEFPLPYTHAYFLNQGYEIIPGIIFLFALVVYLKKGYWKEDAFDSWVIVSIIFATATQLLFMANSQFTFDALFYAAYMSKLVSYLAILIGLIASIYEVFLELEASKIELEESNKKLQKLNVMKDEFLAVASHELRTPMTVIQGYLSLFISGSMGTFTEKQNSIFQKIFTRTQGLIHLVNDMLDLSKLESGVADFEIKSLDICEYINSKIEDYDVLLSKKNIVFDYKNNLKEGCCVLVDEHKLTQIFTNLVSNAKKFTPEKGSIIIETNIVKKDVQVSISDTGIGIPENQQESIFEKFTQVENASQRQYKGTGLGLSIVKNIIENMGGKIWLESVEGEGSTFYFTLPICKKYSSKK